MSGHKSKQSHDWLDGLLYKTILPSSLSLVFPPPLYSDSDTSLTRYGLENKLETEETVSKRRPKNCISAIGLKGVTKPKCMRHVNKDIFY